MESWLVVTLCVTVALMVCQAHAHPKTLAELQQHDDAIKPTSEGPLVGRSPDDLQGVPPVELSKPPRPLDVKVSSIMMEKKEPTTEKEDRLLTSPSSPETNIKLTFPEELKQVVSSKEEDEKTRSKKSTSMRQYSGPHTTTVCIQVRSDHQPRVVCGPQVNDEEETKPAPGPARFAYPSVPLDQYPIYGMSRPNGQFIMSPQQPNRARASAPQFPQQMLPANQFIPKHIQEGSPVSSPVLGPAAAKGRISMMYPTGRSEGEPTLKPADPSQIPSHVPPQPILPNVVVHRQSYQIVPLPLSLMRLNCALQPENGVIPAYTGPFSRNPLPGTIPGPYPGGEHLITLQDSQAPSFPPGSNLPIAQSNSQARFAQKDQIISSPYVPDNSATDHWAYVDDDGQAYLVDGPQARAAGESMMEPPLYLRASLPPTQVPANVWEELNKKTEKQEVDLQKSNERLKELELQLQAIRNKSELIKTDVVTPDSPKGSAVTAEPQESKRTDSPERKHRQTHRIIR